MREYRTIYMIEVYNDDCTGVTVRRYARNKKTAEKIGKQFNDAVIYKVPKRDYQFINMEWVEG